MASSSSKQVTLPNEIMLIITEYYILSVIDDKVDDLMTLYDKSPTSLYYRLPYKILPNIPHNNDASMLNYLSVFPNMARPTFKILTATTRTAYEKRKETVAEVTRAEKNALGDRLAQNEQVLVSLRRNFMATRRYSLFINTQSNFPWSTYGV